MKKILYRQFLSSEFSPSGEGKIGKYINPKLISAMIFWLALTINCAAQVASGGAFSLEKSAVAGGGGTSAGGAFSITGTSGQHTAGTSSANSPFSQSAGFWTRPGFQPSAPTIIIGGRVTTADGRGIRNAMVTLMDLTGNVRAVVTGAFGFYRFSGIEAGENYVLEVSGKRFVFENPVRVINVQQSREDFNFQAK